MFWLPALLFPTFLGCPVGPVSLPAWVALSWLPAAGILLIVTAGVVVVILVHITHGGETHVPLESLFLLFDPKKFCQF